MLLPDVARLPSLAEILKNDYFNLPLPTIAQFLKRLPLQSAEDKEKFFGGLHEKLRGLPGSVVAVQLLPLLLSRYVFMEITARRCLLPHLLVPQSSLPPPSTSLQPILPLPLYLEHLVPHLKLLFSVPDTCVRLTLLEHWPHYVPHLSRETLAQDLLPFLLLGMRDIDPIIVESTLRCLADLVPILGPEVVVGSSNRSKIFSDGSPGKRSKANSDEARANNQMVLNYLASRKVDEDKVEEIHIADNEDWDKWNDEDDAMSSDNFKVEEKTKDCEDDRDDEYEVGKSELYTGTSFTSNVDKIIKNIEDLDIMKLDIKVTKPKTDKVEDVDFFADMTPVIVKGSSSLEKFEEKLARETNSPEKTGGFNLGKFAAPDDDEEADWGDEDWE